jgi:hypothetical protein
MLTFCADAVVGLSEAAHAEMSEKQGLRNQVRRQYE